MSYDNSPLLVERSERGFWVRAEQIDTGKSLLGIGYTLAQSGIAVPHTGTVAETTLYSTTIPGGLMGPNGVLRVISLWTITNNANNKICRFRFGGVALQNYTATALAHLRISQVVFNRGSEGSQVCGGANQSFQDGVNVSSAGASSVDTGADQVLSFTAQLGSAADVITLEAFLIEVLPG